MGTQGTGLWMPVVMRVRAPRLHVGIESWGADVDRRVQLQLQDLRRLQPLPLGAHN